MIFYEIVVAMQKVGCSILWIFLVFTGCHPGGVEKYQPSSDRTREKYATPEPGTFLKPGAYSIMKKFNQIMKDPEGYRLPADWMLDILATPQKKMVDTTLRLSEVAVPVRIYYPTRNSLEGNHPVILFFHGGGFIMGDIETYHVMVSKLARITGQIVISVDYRLAPEYPFPAALQDCYNALKWLQEHGSSIGVDTTRISIMGDSAGGNIATVLTLMCRDRERPQPRCQILVYPGVTFVDTLTSSRNYFCNSPEMIYILSESFLRKVKSEYMGDEPNDRHPYLSPLEANLTGDLCPALIITAECDPLRDDGRLFARKMEAAGVDVQYCEYSGMIHGFMSFHMILSDALLAMKEIRDFVESK